MNQTCQSCGYESPLGVRYCRQCGAQLYAETESSAAGTRNFGRQDPAPSVATAASGHLPASVADVVAGETARYYQSAAPYAPVAAVPFTAPIKSRIGNWRWFVLALVLIIGVMIGALLTASVRRGGPRIPVDSAQSQQQNEERMRQQEERRRQQEERRRQDEFRRDAQNQTREAENRARDAVNRAREAMRQAEEAARRAIDAGAALAPADEKLLDLAHYDYPGAKTSASIRIPGRELLTLRTTDDFDAVNQFYQKKLGRPIIEVNESYEKRLIFQSKTSPLISVSVETVPGPKGQELKITVFRSPFRFPSSDETQN